LVAAERDGMQIRMPTRFALIALDESLDDEPGISNALADRLAFGVNLDPLKHEDSRDIPMGRSDILRTREGLKSVRLSDTLCEALCSASFALGVGSLRPLITASHVARMHAALNHRSFVEQEDMEAALRLVMLPRATMIPEPVAEEAQQEPQAPEAAPDSPNDSKAEAGEDDRQPTAQELAELLIASAKAKLPPDLLMRLQAGSDAKLAGRETGRAGAVVASAMRGRPTGVRHGSLGSGARLNVLETLRAAAPWQQLRKREQSTAGSLSRRPRLEVRKQDIRIHRHEQHGETTTVFIVDASGSAALHRLAESKGAVELLLSDCYVRRDHVALIAFRGNQAELVLPPTRSLTRAKRALTGLAGGGGTPLGLALQTGFGLSDAERRRGRMPVLVVLTDGQANVCRDGTRNRGQAMQEALEAARLIKSKAMKALLLDISPRPARAAADVAAEMGARLVPLPYADAAAVSAVVKAETSPGSSVAGRLRKPASVI
jgi:magnesium chelatase subunit D